MALKQLAQCGGPWLSYDIGTGSSVAEKIQPILRKAELPSCQLVRLRPEEHSVCASGAQVVCVQKVIRRSSSSHESLIVRMALRDEVALTEFYRKCSHRVFVTALAIVRDRSSAEEVSSDTFLQVWRDASQYASARGSVLSWVCTIARSRAFDTLRRRARFIAYELPSNASENEISGLEEREPYSYLAERERSRSLHVLLDRLEPMQRQLVSQAFFHGLTHQEVATQNDLPLGTVKSHLRRTLTKLHGECISSSLTPSE